MLANLNITFRTTGRGNLDQVGHQLNEILYDLDSEDTRSITKQILSSENGIAIPENELKQFDKALVLLEELLKITEIHELTYHEHYKVMMVIDSYFNLINRYSTHFNNSPTYRLEFDKVRKKLDRKDHNTHALLLLSTLKCLKEETSARDTDQYKVSNLHQLLLTFYFSPHAKDSSSIPDVQLLLTGGKRNVHIHQFEISKALLSRLRPDHRDIALALYNSENLSAASEFFIGILDPEIREKFLAAYEQDTPKPADKTSSANIVWRLKNTSISQAHNVNLLFTTYPLSLVFEQNYFGERSLELLQEAYDTRKAGTSSAIRKLEAKTTPYRIVYVGLGIHFPFGSTFEDLEIVYECNALVSKDLSRTATLVLEGRVSPEFIRWATGQGVHLQGAVPHVEILYRFRLPSGQSYFLPLQHVHSSHSYPHLFNNSNFSEEDRMVVNGIRAAISQNKLLELLATPEDGIHVEDAHRLAALNPADLTLETDTVYLLNHGNALCKALIQCWNTYNQNDGRDAEIELKCSMGDLVALFDQIFFSQPGSRSLNLTEAEYQDLRESVVKEVEYLILERNSAELTRDRYESSDPMGIALRSSRIKDGYPSFLPPQGISLDPAHMVLDMLQSNIRDQRPRTYTNRERFITTPDQFHAMIEDLPSQRKVLIRYSEPSSTKNGVNQNVVEIKFTPNDSDHSIESRIMDLELNMLRFNINRLESLNDDAEFLEAQDEALAIAWNSSVKKKNLDETENKILLTQVFSQLHSLRRNLDSQIKILRREWPDEIASLADRFPKDQLKAEINRCNAKYRALELPLLRDYEDVLKRMVFGPLPETEDSWEEHYRGINPKKYLKVLIEIRDVDAFKLIDVVDGEDRLIFNREPLPGDVAFSPHERASHSELAGGLNIYAAGQTLFERHRVGFVRFSNWYDFNQSIQLDVPYFVTKKDNGSGHYRPVVDTISFGRTRVERFIKRYHEWAKDMNLKPHVKIPNEGIQRVDLLLPGIYLS